MAGSSTVDYLQHNAQLQEFPTLDQMFKGLLDKSG